jgi:hypothetical protein
MLTGHAFPVWVKVARIPGKTRQNAILGYTQYTQMWSLFSRAVPGHYGTTGQWTQAGGDYAAGSPWGSIEGGFFVAPKYGGIRYHVAASTHRYDPRSDTLGGYGFYEQGLPWKYIGRVVLSQTLLLPPYGMCFVGSDEGKLFGSGWIALPLFEFTKQDPLTWTFFAGAANFNGPVCCYPPQFFARRVQSWAQRRRAEDPLLAADYTTSNTDASLAFNGPGPGTSQFSVGGEIPNLECAFVSRAGGADGPLTWKVPEIRLPVAGSVWVSDARFYYEDNYAQVKTQLDAGAAPAMLSVAASLDGSFNLDIGAKLVVEPNVTEIDDVLDIDARIVGKNGALVVEGSDAGRTLGRYFRQTATIKDQIMNGTSKIVNRRLSVKIGDSEPATRTTMDYGVPEKPVTFENAQLEEYVRAHSYDGIRTTRLEDGTTVRYGMVKFIKQPAIVSLAADFPSDFTPAKLANIQRRFEGVSKMTLEGSTRPLVRIDPGMIVTPMAGYVPVAVGSSHPAGGPATQMYEETW